MNTNEKADLQEQTVMLTAAGMMEGVSRLAQAQYAANVAEILKPYNGALSAYLRTLGGALTRKLFRIRRQFEPVFEHFPPTFLKVAEARGIQIYGTEERPFGKYTEVVTRILPPPKHDKPVEDASRYWDQVEQTLAEKKQVHKKVEARTGEAVTIFSALPLDERKEIGITRTYRMFKASYRRLPKKGNSREDMLDTVVGYMLQEAGITQRTFKATAIPDNVKAGRGRPRSTEVAAATA
jgi:hypothetical protein